MPSRSPKPADVRALILALAVTASAAMTVQPRDELSELRRAFDAPPADSRIMMRWWWFGPAVTKAGLARELETMKAGGIGGVEIQPVYPLEPDDPSRGLVNASFLSGEFLEALRFANEKARELGLRVDLTLGSGWPYGGPQVGLDHAAAKLRVEKIAAGSRAAARPAIGPGEQLIAELPAADGSGDTLAFIVSRTGMMVKRAAFGAEGYVLDHYDRGAIDSYLDKVGGPLLRALGSAPPHAIFCDSLEVYESDWTPDFLKEFAARRGYDLTPHLPQLVGNAPATAALRRDWGRTLTELLDERFVAPLQEWAHRHQTTLRMQAYGIPPAALATSARVDFAEGEGAQWKALSATRWASSASHLLGRAVTSSETWTWLRSPVFRATPLDMKAEADIHFLQGINQLIGHGWPYTAEGVAYPGWRFYAAGVFNEKNPWWIVMPDIARYLQRASFLLRQGAPVNDVAVLLPTDDAWAHFAPGRVSLFETLRERVGPAPVPQIVGAGFGFDFVDEGLLARARGHRAIVLPGVERIAPATLQWLEEFARAGGAVIATRRLPDLAPGFKATEADHAQVRERVRQLFRGPGAPGVFVRPDDGDLAAALRRAARPDVVFAPAAPDVGFVHRRTNEADIYFIANTSNVRQKIVGTFRVDASASETWNLFDGRVAEQPARFSREGAAVDLDLEPYGSRVIAFPRADARLRASRHISPAAPVRLKPDTAYESLELTGPWRVAFRGGPTVTMDRLRSWTDDEATRYFSGVATYEKEIVVSDAIARAGRVALDFGEATPVAPQPLRSGMQAWLDAPVREAAVVYVNDRRAGRCGALRTRSTSRDCSRAGRIASGSTSPTSRSTTWPDIRCRTTGCSIFGTASASRRRTWTRSASSPPDCLDRSGSSRET